MKKAKIPLKISKRQIFLIIKSDDRYREKNEKKREKEREKMKSYDRESRLKCTVFNSGSHLVERP